jgi:phospholipase C
MSGFRIWRLFASTVLLLAAMVMAGCMGLVGSSNNGSSNNGGGNPAAPTPSNPNPGPNPNPNPTPNPTPPNPTASIAVTPTTVQSGGTVTVSWQTQNANTIALTQNGTSVRLDGNPVTSPGMQFTLNTVGTTTFTLTATGPAGTQPATSSASVTVTAPPPPAGPTATLTATPTTVTAGGAVTLKWTTTNANSVKLTQNGQDVPIGAGQTTTVVTLNQVGTTAFVLTATGAQGATATAQASVQVTAATSPGDISAVNHIIFLAQENRSFDVYFGKLNEYRAKFGLSREVEGLPDDCLSSNSNWTVKCSAMNKAPNAAGVPTTPIYAFHLKTMCIENTSADWIVSRWAFNAENPSSDTPLMDGFVIGAASATPGAPGTNPTIPDKQGIRAMGFYTAQDLEYHYWLATQFGVADHWFSPAPSRTDPNRYFLVGATSGGYAYPIAGTEPSIHAPTIFDRLEAAGVSWKIYSNELYTSAAAFTGFMGRFGPNGASPHIFKLAQFDTDVAGGTLPAVAYIERADNDEHPGLGANIQAGVKDTARLINEVMNSSAWKDSVFILTFDEAGGLYDHVPPPTNVPSPDGIKPVDICTSASDPRCANAKFTHGTPPYDPDGNFTRYGFRVPTVVISPFARPGYVSHRVTDSTSWLKFVETRFKLAPLTARDAAASDMLDFFDFQNAPWKKPPSNPPATPIGQCYDGLP